MQMRDGDAQHWQIQGQGACTPLAEVQAQNRKGREGQGWEAQYRCQVCLGDWRKG